MKFLVLSENGNGTWPYLYYRGMGALELHKRIQQHGYQSTLIDWFTVWSPDKLTTALQAWFGDEANPVIAISTPFDITDVYKIILSVGFIFRQSSHDCFKTQTLGCKTIR